MLGYEISWAAFNVIEVMSSVKFTHKVSFMVLFFLYVLLLYILPFLLWLRQIDGKAWELTFYQ